jgi:hypothetical protein
MPLTSGGNYDCAYCSRNYKDKVYYNRHVATCQFLHQSARERNADIDSEEQRLPSTRELLALIQTMALRIDKLEETNTKLMQKARKVNVIEWLTARERQPTKCFVDWVRDEMIPRVPDMLDVVYQHDLITAVVQLFTDACRSAALPIPIRMFEHRTNVVYLYQEGGAGAGAGAWAAVPAATFDTYIKHICHHFIVDFNTHWYMVHQEKVAAEESFKDKYVDYYKRILGGGKFTDDVLFAKIRAQIHSKLKQNVRAGVEVDFA